MKRSPDFKIGQKIDDFKLDNLLGSGQDGEVWQAKRVSLGKRCAMKFLNAIDDLDKLERFEREIRILAELDHPHIVSIQKRGEAWNPTTEKTVPYYVMEFIPGLPIKKAISELPQNQQFDSFCILFIQILSALDEIHKIGISHGDIKSANILVLKQQSIAKLSDFGFGLLSGEKRSRTEYPSSSYKAPSHLNNQEADLYRLGKTLSDCLESLTVPLLPSAERAIKRLIEDLISESPITTSSDAILRLRRIQAAANNTNSFYEEIYEAIPELKSTFDNSILIRDPIHGDILLSSRVVSIIDSQPFQCTRWLKAFPSASLIYPALSLSKFELILGEFASLRQAVIHILEDRRIREIVTTSQLTTLLLTCLVRHLGELPFEWLLQEAKVNIKPIRDRTLKIIHDDPINELISTQWGLDTQLVLDILFGDYKKFKTPEWHLLSWLLDHPLAPSQIEWMRRISWGSGISTSDLDRFYYGLTLSPDSRTFLVKSSSIGVLEDILRTRYLMYERVLNHTSIRCADLMLIRSFAELNSYGYDFSTSNFNSDIELLRSCYQYAEENNALKASYLIKAYLERQLLKRVVIINPREMFKKSFLNFSNNQIAHIEKHLAKSYDIDENEIMLDIPQHYMNMLPETFILSGGRTILADDYSPLLKAIVDQTKSLTNNIVLYCSARQLNRLKSEPEKVEEMLYYLLSKLTVENV